MEKHIDTEELIDLGAVAVETRGQLPVGQLDNPAIPNQCFETGLSAD